MKHLLLIRHAKSSWKFPELDDHDRPLNKRGQRDVLTMSEFLVDQGGSLEMIYSSSAVRALSYSTYLSDACSTPLEINKAFYTFSAQSLMLNLGMMDNELKSVAVVGHNPAITDVVNQLTGSNIVNVPTAAIASLSLELSKWQEIRSGCAKLKFLQTPKGFKGGNASGLL